MRAIISASALAGALLLAVVASPSPAMAQFTVNFATLDGGAQWTNGGGFTDGDPVTVAPGATIEVAINVTASVPGTQWRATAWDVNGTSACVDHGNYNNTTATETFNITAPAVPGTYDLTLTAREQNDCTGASGAATLVDAIIVEVPPPDVTKTLLDGPNDADGNACTTLDVDGACSDTADTLVVNTHDDGGIWVGLEQSQHYVFEILIENNTGVTLDSVVNDVVPADFDMDPGAEAGTFDAFDPNNDVCTDLDCNGVESDNPACTVALSQPPDNGNSPKEPEFIDISVNDLADGDSCTVTVYVMTVLNPGLGNDLFEPTSCRVKVQTVTVEEVIETFSLNEGVKVYDPTTSPPERLLGPVGSLQLTCNFPPEVVE